MMNIAVANQAPVNSSAQDASVTAGACARRVDSTASVSGGMAFEALLAAMQLVTPEALAGRLESSAEQMFEAPDPAGQTGGDQAGQELDDALDPTSVTARKAARTAPQANAAAKPRTKGVAASCRLNRTAADTLDVRRAQTSRTRARAEPCRAGAGELHGTYPRRKQPRQRQRSFWFYPARAAGGNC